MLIEKTELLNNRNFKIKHKLYIKFDTEAKPP